jgi:DNA-binding NtrC family response regulator
MEKKILVIDDESAVRKILCDNLKMAGFRVESAEDGDKGLAMIDPAAPPAVVITDIIMPNKSGLDVISEIRRTYPAIKVIAISGGGRIKETNDLLEKAKELGADVVMPKPVDLDALERTIEDFLR